jgi:hypothetical protein
MFKAGAAKKSSRALVALAAILGAAAALVLIIRNRDPGPAARAPVPATAPSSPTPRTQGQRTRPPVPRLVQQPPKGPPAAFLAQNMSFKDSYNSEARNPAWAVPMERQLRLRFDEVPPEKAGVPGAKVSEIECRTTMCRVVLHYPASLWEPGAVEYPGTRFRMWDVYGRGGVGPMADGTNVVDREDLPDGTIRETMVLAFWSESFDPARYGEWARKAREQRLLRQAKRRQ